MNENGWILALGFSKFTYKERMCCLVQPNETVHNYNSSNNNSQNNVDINRFGISKYQYQNKKADRCIHNNLQSTRIYADVDISLWVMGGVTPDTSAIQKQMGAISQTHTHRTIVENMCDLRRHKEPTKACDTWTFTPEYHTSQDQTHTQQSRSSQRVIEVFLLELWSTVKSRAADLTHSRSDHEKMTKIRCFNETWVKLMEFAPWLLQGKNPYA